MNAITFVAGCLAVFCATGSCFSEGVELLPGLTYCAPPVPLPGSLVFQYSSSKITNGLRSPLYSFDLQRGVLRVVTDSPGGSFYPSRDGKTLCVLHGMNRGLGIYDTNAFVYSDTLRRSRELVFKRRPKLTRVEADNVMFLFEDSVAHHYDLAADVLLDVALPAADNYEVRNVCVAPRAAHLMRFECINLGTAGGDICCDYNLRTRTLTVTNNVSCEEGTLRTVDNRYVFFSGKQGPGHGGRLVSSPWGWFESARLDPKGKELRVLNVFPHANGYNYGLGSIYADGRYAWVVHRSMIVGTDRWRQDYYIVDVVSKATQLLIRQEVGRFHGGSASEVHWVASEVIKPTGGAKK